MKPRRSRARDRRRAITLAVIGASLIALGGLGARLSLGPIPTTIAAITALLGFFPISAAAALTLRPFYDPRLPEEDLDKCPSCNYDITGINDWKCPECGRVLERQFPEPQSNQHGTPTKHPNPPHNPTTSNSG